MPIYGYQCDQCGHQLEVLQNLSDPPIRACPECMGPMQKMLYPVGVIFKGSGFYTTDYKNNANDGNGGSDKAESGGSSESKPSESKTPDSKSSDAKASESKSSESKSSESKSSESSSKKPDSAPTA